MFNICLAHGYLWGWWQWVTFIFKVPFQRLLVWLACRLHFGDNSVRIWATFARDLPCLLFFEKKAGVKRRPGLPQ